MSNAIEKHRIKNSRKTWRNENEDMTKCKQYLMHFHDFYNRIPEVPELWIDAYMSDEEVELRTLRDQVVNLKLLDPPLTHYNRYGQVLIIKAEKRSHMFTYEAYRDNKYDLNYWWFTLYTSDDPDRPIGMTGQELKKEDNYLLTWYSCWMRYPFRYPSAWKLTEADMKLMPTFTEEDVE